ncbi:MAG: class I SAM-dependent methyltransferase [Pseudomonadota bacterium]
MPTQESFWDRQADSYAKKPVKDMAAYERKLEWTRAYLSSDDRILEAGCGTGSTALLLAKDVAYITAIDISERMIEIANDKQKKAGIDNITFKKATLDTDTSEPAAFDAVLAFSFLHLLDDPGAAVRRIYELVKPGGVFISKTVCLRGKAGLWPVLIKGMQIVGYAPNVTYLDAQRIETLITEAGFEIEETADFPGSLTSRFVIARKP